ncbi:TPA: hypothetical protein VDA67_001900 [Burkholderia vietnamiensis]|nr:hypothetical protein [Burkholderia vietnamiensis]HEP6283568.1 hypothetical protein [Burkholderia vietnamiensis]HEP6309038.1 hypothetical protein [Burkholderia vietnamiensis]
MLTIIVVLLFLILLAIAAPSLLLRLALVVAWPLDLLLNIGRLTLLLLGLPFFLARSTSAFLYKHIGWVFLGLSGLFAIELITTFIQHAN